MYVYSIQDDSLVAAWLAGRDAGSYGNEVNVSFKDSTAIKVADTKRNTSKSSGERNLCIQTPTLTVHRKDDTALSLEKGYKKSKE